MLLKLKNKEVVHIDSGYIIGTTSKIKEEHAISDYQIADLLFYNYQVFYKGMEIESIKMEKIR